MVLVAGAAAVTFGVLAGFYRFLTADLRRATREIRLGAAARGWRYRSIAGSFRIESATWTMMSSGSGEGERRWAAELNMRFPGLGGETDLAIVPRDGKSLFTAAVPAGVEAGIARFSGTLAGAARFLREAHEVPSGVAEFDAAYEVRVRGDGLAPVDAALAGRILDRPADAVAVHSMIAWRDPFGFHCNARLAGPPEWAIVDWLVEVGEECAGRLPAAVSGAAPTGLVDRVVGWFLR